MLRRAALGLVAATMLFACGGAPTALPSGATDGVAPLASPVSTPRGSTPGPLATAEPIEIPEPTLNDPEAIGLGFTDPDRAPQAVVSLLALAGIGIYGLDGSVVRAGPDAGRGDPWLFDDEVRGLIAMAAEDAATLAAGGTPSTLDELATPIAALLGEGATVRSVLDAYGETYALQPDRLMTGVAGGLVFVEDEPVSRAVAWFLLVDGIVGLADRTVAAAGLAALGGPGPAVAAASGAPIFGIPSGIAGLTVEELAVVATHLPLLGFTIPLTVGPGGATGHEGHGGPGDLVTITARVLPGGAPIVSPVTGVPLLMRRPGSSMAGLDVEFRPVDPAILAAHGSLHPPTGQAVTDATGTATLDYQLRQEPADGIGDEELAATAVMVTVGLADLVTHQFDVPPPLRPFLGSGERVVPVSVAVSWHEDHPTSTFGPGAWAVELQGPAPGAGRYSGVADLVICVAPPTIPYREWTAVLSPTGSQVLHISIGEQADGRVSASVAAGDGELMAWHVDSNRPGAVVDLRFDPALPRPGAPVTFVLTATWYTGTDPRTLWSMDIAVTCPEVDGLEQPQPS
ncbi:MAG TPA: hypothetical protein VFX65_05750 [Candidatus Limnocylindrales bacterium]|nr:hypothetical protein [Candidatus Limnocylindrales bacterium]